MAASPLGSSLGSSLRSSGRLALLAGAAAALLLAACSADDADSRAESTGGMPGAAAMDDADSVTGNAGGGMTFPQEPGVAVSPGKDGAGAPSGSSGEGFVSLPDVLGRTVIRHGSIYLTVESVSESFDRVRQIAEGSGGFVADSTFSGSDERQSASLTLRVPAERFAQVVSDLQGIAVEVESVQTSSQDVTEEYSDLEATIRNLQAVEQQYITLLNRADNITDILQIQDRLASVRLQIDQAQGRLNLLDNMTSLATLSVTLVPEAAGAETRGGEGFLARVQEAWESSLDAIASVATGVAVAVVWSWWLLPLIPIAWFAWRRFGRPLLRERRSVDTPQAQA